MSGLHKIKRKCVGALTAAFLFCIVLTQAAPHTTNGQITASSFFVQDTVPKKAVSNRQTATSNRQPATGNKNKADSNAINVVDSAEALNDTLPQRAADSTLTTQKSDTFSVKMGKDTMDAPVTYQAEDSAVLLVKQQKFILYGKTQTKYKDVDINAPRAVIDQQTNLLTALGERDTLGRLLTRATFKDKSQMFESDSFQYNFKSQKGITANTYTNETEMYIHAEVSKKVDERTVYVKRGMITTCNLDDPHFGFLAGKMKVISNSLAVSGPIHPEFEGIPLPIYLPFGIFPLSQGRHSGFLAPQFTSNQQFGIGLEGLGWYEALNDYVDVTVRTNLYSYGGWNLNIIPQYRKRYRYQGSFNLSLTHTKFAFKGDPDYQLVKTFQINWSHSVNPNAKPGTNFSASVNAGSTRHNDYVANNPYKNFQNNLYSSITYSKQWQGKPYSMQLSANHNQNSLTHLINVTLPDAGFTLTTQYPFQRKTVVGTPRWYEKIGVGYNAVARNQFAFYDTGRVSFGSIMDTLQWGAQHRFPVSLQLPPLGKLFISPSINYDETWYTRRLSRVWNGTTKKVDTLLLRKGFYTDRSLNFALSFNTNIYGMYEFGKNSNIVAIRHVMRPTISFNYKPNISKRNFDVIQVDTTGRKLALPQFEGNLFSPYSYGRYGGLSFGLDNNLEMKVRSKKDTANGGTKKVKLIDGFGFTSGYNFLDTAFKLQPFNLYFRTTLFEKLSITAQGQLDPYRATDSGLRVNRFVWEGGRFTPGRFTGGSISASTSFQSKPKDADKAKQQQASNTITDPTLLTDQQALQDYMQRNPAEFVDFNIPWSVNLSFSLSLTRTLKPDYSGYVSNVSSSLSFNNSFNLTPKWNFSTNGFFDFNTRQLTMFTMSIAREMHCWQMAIGVTPIGNYQYFNVTISPKSSLLKDLRVNRTRYFYNY